MTNGLLQFLADSNERASIRQGFMDAVNRGAIGATLGAPVDMANGLLNLVKAGGGYLGHKTGLLSADQMPELIDNPVGGSEWFGKQMQNTGMVSDKRNQVAEMLAGVLPISPATSAKAVAAMGMGGVVPGMDAAATVWHGSPHKFDRFDASKIGTGEGAQAYGHGLYLAENQGVAEGYKNGLSSPNKFLYRDLENALPNALKGKAADWSDAILQGKTFDDLLSEVKFPYQKTLLQSAKPKIDELIQSQQSSGSLYKVDLPDENIARMLDWDKPLSQQAPEVRSFFEPHVAPLRKEYAAPAPEWGDLSSGGAYEPSGQELLGLLRNRDANLSAADFLSNGLGPAASEKLRQAGIPGIRYFDGGSRSAGQGSSNYVVFPGNEGLLTILERNGQPLK